MKASRFSIRLMHEDSCIRRDVFGEWRWAIGIKLPIGFSSGSPQKTCLRDLPTHHHIIHKDIYSHTHTHTHAHIHTYIHTYIHTQTDRMIDG